MQSEKLILPDRIKHIMKRNQLIILGVALVNTTAIYFRLRSKQDIKKDGTKTSNTELFVPVRKVKKHYSTNGDYFLRSNFSYH